MNSTVEQNARAEKRVVTVDGVKLNHRHHVTFVDACRKVGFKPFFYDEGFLCYAGPAIIVSVLTDVACLGIDVPLAWDHMGKEYVVHPRVSSNEHEDERINALRWFYNVTSGSIKGSG